MSREEVPKNVDKQPNLNLKVLNSIVEIENKSIQSEKVVYEEFLQRLDTFIQSYGDPRSEVAKADVIYAGIF